MAGPFVRPELFRLPALGGTWPHLRGPGRRARPERAARDPGVTRTGCGSAPERWPGGYVAHHYTRYLGDLSGGQIIRDRAEAWDFARKGDGVRFIFDAI